MVSEKDQQKIFALFGGEEEGGVFAVLYLLEL